MIRVLIVDKPRLLCQTMRAVLQKQPDMTVVSCASTVEEALAHICTCDVVLVNTTMTHEDTLSLIQDIANQAPEVKVLVVGVGEVSEIILCYVEAGAAGYVLQEDSVEDLLSKIRAAYNDEALVSPRIAATLMSRLAELATMRETLWSYPRDKVDALVELTPREREILSLLGEGLSNQGIAERLIIEYGTVKNHVHSILKKLNATNRQEAAAVYWLQHNNGRTSVFAY
ncbi:MAG: response regulator transcription factor [Chloroflexi bacterium]|nr:response regulator transcription factor [Chloroflexota bacterium]MCI0726238.1 response regulator transcription factor [Chloroflexota bacterium]